MIDKRRRRRRKRRRRKKRRRRRRRKSTKAALEAALEAEVEAEVAAKVEALGAEIDPTVGVGVQIRLVGHPACALRRRERRIVANGGGVEAGNGNDSLDRQRRSLSQRAGGWHLMTRAGNTIIITIST